MTNSLHVLVVEDTHIAQIVIKTQLYKQNCTVDIAVDGASAIRMANKFSYDLILMDIGLGDGPDGFEVTLNIKKNSLLNSMTPIVAVTAHNEPDFAEKASAVGMEGFFNKPFTYKNAEIVTKRFNKLLKYQTEES